MHRYSVKNHNTCPFEWLSSTCSIGMCSKQTHAANESTLLRSRMTLAYKHYCWHVMTRGWQSIHPLIQLIIAIQALMQTEVPQESLSCSCDTVKHQNVLIKSANFWAWPASCTRSRALSASPKGSEASKGWSRPVCTSIQHHQQENTKWVQWICCARLEICMSVFSSSI